jgi:hypothetical protein
LCVLAAGAVCRAQEDGVHSAAEVPAPYASPAAGAPQPASVLRCLFGPGAFAQTLSASVYDQIRHFPAEWGRSRYGGFQKRAASEYGQVAIGNLIQSGVQKLHKEDPRYFRRGQGNFFARTFHVIGNTLVVHSTDGRRTVSLALPAYAYGSWAIAARWSPADVRGAGDFFLYGSSNIATKAAGNFFREFWPDVKRRFVRR